MKPALETLDFGNWRGRSPSSLRSADLRHSRIKAQVTTDILAAVQRPKDDASPSRGPFHRQRHFGIGAFELELAAAGAWKRRALRQCQVQGRCGAGAAR